MLPRLLDSNMRETKRLNALDASITERIIPLSTATVILPDTETLPLRSWVRMFNGYGESAIYRVNTPGLNIDNCTSEYQLDHGVCEIGDYIINSDAEYSGAANTVISQIFSNYRGSLWQLGTVAASDQVEVNSDHGDVLSALLDAVEQLPDYAITLDQSTTPWTFAVAAKSSAIGGEGRLSRNIASLDISEDTSALCTRLYGDALTGGHMDADTISLYGVVEQYAGKGEGTTQGKYLADCQKYLDQHKHPLRVIKIDLHDLHAVTGEPLDKAELGKLYRLALPKYNIIESQRVFAREWPSLFGEPDHIVVTLGNEAMDMNALFDSYSATSASNSSKEKRKSEAQSAKWRFTDKHVTDQGEILHAAGLEIDAHGVWLYASEDGPNYALGASFKVQADAITSEVNRATTAEGTMNSRITQTADAITAEVTRATTAEGQMSSRITQTADAITAEVTRATDAEGNLSSRITINAEGISTKVEKNGVISAINQTAESVTISASKINLSGYVTTSQLDSTNAAINNLVTGVTSASKLVASNGNFSNLEITNSLVYGGYGDLKSKIISGLSSSASDGQITISSTCLDNTAGPSVNFNIADTQYYKDGVAAAKNNVTLSGAWDDYSGSTVGYTVTASNNKTNTVNMSLSVGSGEVYLKSNDLIRASISIPTYSFGSMTITSNGTYNAPTYGYSGFSYVTVNVPTSSGEYVSVGYHDWYYNDGDGYVSMGEFRAYKKTS